MGPNILKYEKQFNINNKTMSKKEAQAKLKEIKDDQISQIVNIQPILARGIFDHLIEFEPGIDPPKLRWKKDHMETMDTGVLMGIKNVLENKQEQAGKRY